MARVPEIGQDPSDNAVDGQQLDPPARPLLRRIRNGMLAAESRLNRLTRSPVARRWLLPIGLVIFVVITVLSFLSLRNGVHLRWWAVGVVLAATPVTVLINAAEYRLMGQINGHRIGWMSASRLTVFATAANLLPLPGGVLIRTQALRMRGSSYRHALLVNAVAMLAWLSVGAVVIAGLLFPTSAYRVAAVVLVALGVAGAAACPVLLRGLRVPGLPVVLGKLFLIELLKVIFGGARIYFAFQSIGYTATPAQAVALTAANILSAAIGIFPSGLGLREALAGVIGAAMSLSLAEAVATTAADRVVSQIGLVIVLGALLATDRRRGEGRGFRSMLSSAGRSAAETEVGDAGEANDPTSPRTGRGRAEPGRAR
jgi:uncharacterized membrane protein YbhN (UPF0104 family)